MRLDIDSRCKTTLKHHRNPFLAIYHHFGRYQPIYRKSNFGPKSRFLRYSRIWISHNMVDHMAGNAQKCNQRTEMASLNPQNMCKYLG